MSSLSRTLCEYLALRRALGFRLYRPGQALEKFVAFAEHEGAAVITTNIALRWAQLPTKADDATRAGRLDLIRRFARYCYSIDPRTQVPPEGLLPHRRRRRSPHIWSHSEIVSLLVAAGNMRSPLGLRSLTYTTFFGLIAVSGLRISEALHLNDGDIDWAAGIITIRDTKFGKTRYVPLHPSTLLAMRRYRRKRDSLPIQDKAAYFVTEHGTRLSESAVRWVFKRLRKIAVKTPPPGFRLARIHDLRHTFAVQTLRGWYRDGSDVEAMLPRLATYIGHAHVNDTYWYLSAVPDLLNAAVSRLEKNRKEQCS